MIAFVFALKSEAEHLLSKVDNLQAIKLLDKTTYTCKINDKDVLIAISGIGKVSAAITTQAIIDRYNPEYVINAGTCGGTDSSVEIKSYYVVEKCFQFDFDVTAIDDVQIGYIQEYDTVFFPTYTKGLDDFKKTSLATADRFSNEEKDLRLIAKNGCAIRDMEGAAISQTCLSNNVNFICLKGVTDIYGSGIEGEQFYSNLQEVSKGLADIILKLIKNI